MSVQQDNGTNIYKGNWGNNWSETHAISGDGMRAIFDYLDPQTLYTSHQTGTIYKSTNGGKDYTKLLGLWVLEHGKQIIA